MKGRHTPWRSFPDPPEDAKPLSKDVKNGRPSDVVKKVVFWIAISACILFTLWAVYVFYAIDQAIDHPEGNSGWLCSGHSSTCEP